MRTHRSLIHLLVVGTLAVGLVSCEHKPSEAVVQAQEAAKSADARVAQLEQEIADIKAGKHAGAGDADAVEQVGSGQLKALQHRLAEAKKTAAQRHQDATELAAMPEKSQPATMTLEVPAGTSLSVVLSHALATDQDPAGTPWEGTLAKDVVQGGRLVWAKGTPVKGVVTQSLPAGRLASGKGGLGIRLSTVGTNDVDAGTYLVSGDKRGERNAKFIGGTAALGALVGALSGSKHQGDHALGGAAIGAAAGTALAAGTADTVIRIPASVPVSFTLSAPEKVTVPRNAPTAP